MSWTETTKNASRFLQTRGTVKVYRGNFPDPKRAKIAQTVRGDTDAEVARKEIEDHYGTRDENSFTETSKGSSEWSEQSK